MSVVILSAALSLTALSEQAKAPKEPASPEYRLGPEDVIESFVSGEPELTTTVPVRPDGMISLPGVGEIQASGKTVLELQAVITTKLKETLNDPIVNVIVKDVLSPKISVFGEVRKPDVFVMKQPMTVFEAIARAGGLTEFAKRAHVTVIRKVSTGQQRIPLNLDRLIKSGDAFYLQAGDTVFVE